MASAVPDKPKHRLFLPELRSSADLAAPVTLDRAQSHYLARVLRLRTDARLLVFDGAGREWQARVGAVGRESATLQIDAPSRHAQPPVPLILIQAWLKGGAMDTVVQKATELGATGIWLTESARSNVGGLTGSRLVNKLAHLNRIAASACEQSGRLHVPVVTAITGLTPALEKARQHGCRILVLDLARPLLAVSTERKPLALVVGPEGGWADKERALFDETADVSCVGLGELTLRAETAPLAALAAIRHSWAWRV